ncbi:MAG: FHA domain-containing protein [Verrucomicrobiota bacterium]
MATMLDAGTAYDRSIDTFQTITDTRGVGSFTTTLAGNATSRIGVTIPEPFLGAGVPGTILKLVPVEILRGRPPLEIYLTTRSEFTLGRSPEADLITIFFPRNEKNDLRSRRLSKIHARVDYRDDLFWVHRKAGASVHIGQQAIGDDPGGYKLRERDQLILAEDFALEIFFDISLRGTLQFNNAEAWRRGALEFSSVALGAVRFEPLNSTPSLRTSCWLFVDVGFGSARGGVITAGSELAPQQGVILYLSGCFWILNLVNNEKVAINDYRPAANELVPLGRNDSIWFGAVRYRAEIA